MIALEEGERTGEPEPLFSPLASTAIVAGGAFASLLLFGTSWGSRTVLLTPVDRQLEAVMVGIGVFAGVWVAAAVREFWQLGVRLDGPVPEGLALAVKLVVLVLVGGWCGHLAAGQATEWRAFRGLRAPAARESFTVTGFSRYRRSKWLNLVGSSGAPSISVRCGTQDCGPLDVGDRLLVPVETGRGGVRRAVFPAALDRPAARS